MTDYVPSFEDLLRAEIMPALDEIRKNGALNLPVSAHASVAEFDLDTKVVTTPLRLPLPLSPAAYSSTTCISAPGAIAVTVPVSGGAGVTTGGSAGAAAGGKSSISMFAPASTVMGAITDRKAGSMISATASVLASAASASTAAAGVPSGDVALPLMGASATPGSLRVSASASRSPPLMPAAQAATNLPHAPLTGAWLSSPSPSTETASSSTPAASPPKSVKPLFIPPATPDEKIQRLLPPALPPLSPLTGVGGGRQTLTPLNDLGFVTMWTMFATSGYEARAKMKAWYVARDDRARARRQLQYIEQKRFRYKNSPREGEAGKEVTTAKRRKRNRRALRVAGTADGRVGGSGGGGGASGSGINLSDISMLANPFYEPRVDTWYTRPEPPPCPNASAFIAAVRKLLLEEWGSYLVFHVHTALAEPDTAAHVPDGKSRDGATSATGAAESSARLRNQLVCRRLIYSQSDEEHFEFSFDDPNARFRLLGGTADGALTASERSPLTGVGSGHVSRSPPQPSQFLLLPAGGNGSAAGNNNASFLNGNDNSGRNRRRPLTMSVISAVDQKSSRDHRAASHDDASVVGDPMSVVSSAAAGSARGSTTRTTLVPAAAPLPRPSSSMPPPSLSAHAHASASAPLASQSSSRAGAAAGSPTLPSGSPLESATVVETVTRLRLCLTAREFRQSVIDAAAAETGGDTARDSRFGPAGDGDFEFPGPAVVYLDDYE